MEQVEHDPDFITLSRQFKATATELISILEQVKLLARICFFSGKPFGVSFGNA